MSTSHKVNFPFHVLFMVFRYLKGTRDSRMHAMIESWAHKNELKLNSKLGIARFRSDWIKEQNMFLE